MILIKIKIMVKVKIMVEIPIAILIYDIWDWPITHSHVTGVLALQAVTSLLGKDQGL
jgi:hypothetical protein